MNYYDRAIYNKLNKIKHDINMGIKITETTVLITALLMTGSVISKIGEHKEILATNLLIEEINPAKYLKVKTNNKV